MFGRRAATMIAGPKQQIAAAPETQARRRFTNLAPRVGFEPTTKWLTATRSAN